MAKNLKLNIKNTQIAEAINLSGLKGKLASKKEQASSQPSAQEKAEPKAVKTESEETHKEEAPRIRARSKSAFAEHALEAHREPLEPSEKTEAAQATGVLREPMHEESGEVRQKTSAELRQEIFGQDFPSKETTQVHIEPLPQPLTPVKEPVQMRERPAASTSMEIESEQAMLRSTNVKKYVTPKKRHEEPLPYETLPPREKLGPTGKHIKDYSKPVSPPQQGAGKRPFGAQQGRTPQPAPVEPSKDLPIQKVKHERSEEGARARDEEGAKRGLKTPKVREFKEVKPAIKRQEPTRQFDARDRQGLRTSEEDSHWRRRRGKPQRQVVEEDLTIRPTSLKIRLPISVKDLASEMKLKASQLISKLFLQGMALTLNDLLQDETLVQLLGQEFGCEIIIDTSEAQRIQITDKSIREELQATPSDQLTNRPPVVAFMGHVDHGKTSLIDAIRKSNRAAGEAGAITQHIGAFRCHTSVGDIAILDTPGHEAFSAMRARGADVTDIVVLVVAGDEGIRQQTVEAIQHAKAAKVTIVVAINKSDKPNFNAEVVYRQLAELELLPEAWGGQTITVNCSAVTRQGLPELLEMLALQSEVLELRANPHTRARGTVLESEMHKGLGAVATVLVQNGTLHRGDSLVFGQHWGRVKTMYDEYGKEFSEASPSTPVEITGLSGLPEAGQEFIVVKSEREAREISEARSEGLRQSNLLLQQKRKTTMENLLQQASPSGKKILNVILRADVQGSLEALKAAILKIESEKVELAIIFASVGEVSESDVQLAAASKAVVIGFHTQIENHAEPLVKQLGVHVKLHDIIYHAVDDVKLIMSGLLEKIALESERSKVLVKAVFKSSQSGLIAGCQVLEGTIQRNHHVRLKRDNEVVWKGTISSLKRVKEDVREVAKGLECGILLNNFSDVREGDIIESYEITYITQEL